MLSVFTTLSPSQHQTKTCIVFAHSNLGLPSEKKGENATLFYTGAYSTCGVSQVVLAVNNPSTNPGDIRDAGSIPGSGRSPGEGITTHSSILVWRIPWTEEPVGL